MDSVGKSVYLYKVGLRRRHDNQEFGADNDLPYRYHKSAFLCLVCKALMQGEN